jgi:hypothetical protein
MTTNVSSNSNRAIHSNVSALQDCAATASPSVLRGAVVKLLVRQDRHLLLVVTALLQLVPRKALEGRGHEPLQLLCALAQQVLYPLHIQLAHSPEPLKLFSGIGSDAAACGLGMMGSSTQDAPVQREHLLLYA